MGDGEANGIALGIEAAAHVGLTVEDSVQQRFTLPAVAAALCVGCVALLMLGVQPIVLGALLAEHRVTVTELTWAATVEMLGLGFVSALLAGFMPPKRLRGLGATALLVLALANFAGAYCHGVGIIGCRAVAGISGGVVLWIVAGMIDRTAGAVRLAGIFLAVQSLSQALLAAGIPFFLKATGSNTGFVGMGIVALLTLPLVVLLPDRMKVLPKPPPGRGPLSIRGGFGLIATFFMMAGVVGLWVFIEALAKMDGVDEKGAAFVIAASLTTQILGAAAVAAYGHKLPAVPSLVAVGVGNLLVVALIATFHGAGIFLPATFLFGFLWTAGIPLILPLLIRIDPTRRVAMFSTGAQLLGSAAGPVLTGLFATDTNVRPVLTTCAALFCAAMAATLFAGISIRARATA